MRTVAAVYDSPCILSGAGAWLNRQVEDRQLSPITGTADIQTLLFYFMQKISR